MTKYEPAKVLCAVAHTMPCDKCPYSCGKPYQASMASCVNHWFDILSGTEFDEANKSHVLDGVFAEYERVRK